MPDKRRYLVSPKLHLSPADDISSVKKSGLLTAMDHRGAGRIWLCDWDKVPSVAQHLTRLRKKQIIRWAIYSVRYWNIVDSLRQHKQEGIYYVTQDIPPNHITLESTFWCDLTEESPAAFPTIGGRRAVRS